ncbi:MAG: STAS domain-containing protein [Gemmataceae bacterium]
MQSYHPLSRVRADWQDDVLVLRVISGQMLDDRADDLRREINTVLDGQKPGLVALDLSQVSMVSSMAVSVVISLARRVRTEGGDVVLCGLTQFVNQVFRLCRLISDEKEQGIFRVYPDVDTAVAARKASD